MSKWADVEMNVGEGIGEGVGEVVDTSESKMTVVDMVDRNDSIKLIYFEEDEEMDALSANISRLKISQYTTDLEDLEMSISEAPSKLDSACLPSLPVGNDLPCMCFSSQF